MQMITICSIAFVVSIPTLYGTNPSTGTGTVTCLTMVNGRCADGAPLCSYYILGVPVLGVLHKTKFTKSNET